MQFSLTSRYTPGPRQPHLDVGLVNVTMEGLGDRGVYLKPGMILMEAAVLAMVETCNIPSKQALPFGLVFNRFFEKN